MNPHSVVTLLALLFLCISQAFAAGPELVEVINVSNVIQHVCPSSLEKQVFPWMRCSSGIKYEVTFKRDNGTSGTILLASRTTAQKILVNFCAGPQGQLERPCPQ